MLPTAPDAASEGAVGNIANSAEAHDARPERDLLATVRIDLLFASGLHSAPKVMANSKPAVDEQTSTVLQEVATCLVDRTPVQRLV